MRKFNTFIVLLFMIAFFSCTSRNDDLISFQRIDKSKLPKQVLHDVVMINQNDNYSCATTSLAMILSEYKGLHNNPLKKEDIWNSSESSISTIRSLGNDLDGLYRVCDKYGYKYEFVQHMTNEEVQYLLSHNIYMIAFISIDQYRTHAIPLTGYDQSLKVFYANNTNEMKMVLPFDGFNKIWHAMLSHPRMLAERSALVIFPKGIMVKANGLRK